jgi:hypothetical protein
MMNMNNYMVVGDSYTWKNPHTHCFETGIIVDINTEQEYIKVQLRCGTIYTVGL